MSTIDVLGLYAKDTHYYVTYYRLRAKGFAHEDALAIAKADQNVDMGYREPLALGAKVLFGDQTAAMLLSWWHFPGSTPTSATVENDPRVFASALFQTLNWRGCETGNAQRTGEELHRLQDTFGHADFTAWVNPKINHRRHLVEDSMMVAHLDDWKWPDEPFRDPARAVRMVNTLWIIIPEKGNSGVSSEQALSDLQTQFTTHGDEDERGAAARRLIQTRFGVTINE